MLHLERKSNGFAWPVRSYGTADKNQTVRRGNNAVAVIDCGAGAEESTAPQRHPHGRSVSTREKSSCHVSLWPFCHSCHTPVKFLENLDPRHSRGPVRLLIRIVPAFFFA